MFHNSLFFYDDPGGPYQSKEIKRIQVSPEGELLKKIVETENAEILIIERNGKQFKQFHSNNSINFDDIIVVFTKDCSTSTPLPSPPLESFSTSIRYQCPGLQLSETFVFPPHLKFGHVVCVLERMLQNYKKITDSTPLDQHVIMMQGLDNKWISSRKFKPTDSLPPLLEIKFFPINPQAITKTPSYTNGYIECCVYFFFESDDDFFNSLDLPTNEVPNVQLFNEYVSPKTTFFSILSQCLEKCTQFETVILDTENGSRSFLNKLTWQKLTLGDFATERVDVCLFPSTGRCRCDSGTLGTSGTIGTLETFVHESQRDRCFSCGLLKSTNLEHKKKRKQEFQESSSPESKRTAFSLKMRSPKSPIRSAKFKTCITRQNLKDFVSAFAFIPNSDCVARAFTGDDQTQLVAIRKKGYSHPVVVKLPSFSTIVYPHFKNQDRLFLLSKNQCVLPEIQGDRTIYVKISNCELMELSVDPQITFQVLFRVLEQTLKLKLELKTLTKSFPKILTHTINQYSENLLIC